MMLGAQSWFDMFDALECALWLLNFLPDQPRWSSARPRGRTATASIVIWDYG